MYLFSFDNLILTVSLITRPVQYPPNQSTRTREPCGGTTFPVASPAVYPTLVLKRKMSRPNRHGVKRLRFASVSF